MKSQRLSHLSRWVGQWRSTLLPSLSITGLVILTRLLGVLQPLEWKAFDLALRARPAEATDSRITLVTITEEDIQNALGYPISDQDLAALIEELQTYEPRVIGIDIFRDVAVGEGAEALAQTLQADTNIIGIEKIGGQTEVEATSLFSEEQVGFADAVIDTDGYFRRSLLGDFDDDGNYRFSLTIRMAEKYLAADGFTLENGVKDPDTMQFGDVEIPRFFTNTGGYVQADDGGTQTLINFRAGKDAFEQISYQALMNGNVDTDLLTGRAVLVGYTAESVKDFVSSGAIATENPSLVPGVEAQAHAISQLLSAVYDERPFIRTLPDSIEYLLIFAFGLLGMALANWRRKPAWHWALVIASAASGVLWAYGLLIASWWLPIIPVLAAFCLNAVAIYPFRQAQAQLLSQQNAHENFIDQTYNAIHNGPLQTLSSMLSTWPENQPASPAMRTDLYRLNQELRGIYETMRKELLLPDGQIAISQGRTFDLRLSLQELLYEIYTSTLERQRDFFKSVVQITKFEAMADERLSAKQKRDIARFLEEALINVYKYAKDATRLTVTCCQENNNNIVRITDNGSQGLHPTQRKIQGGYGTQQAQKLASRLGGRFTRRAINPKGVCCELRWPTKRSFWKS